MSEEVDWEQYSKHCETALQRAHTRAKTLGDECQEKFNKGRKAHDLVEAQIAYWLADMIDDLRRDMKIGPGYEKGVRKGPDYWKAHTYTAWGKADLYAVEMRRLKDQIRDLKDELDLVRHR